LLLTAASGAVAEERMALLIAGGAYDPGPDVIDDSEIFDLRFNYSLSQKLRVGVSVGFTKFESDALPAGLTGSFDGEVVFIDLGAGYVFRPQKRFSFAVGGGIGGAFTSIDGAIQGVGGSLLFEDVTGDSLTLTAGFGMRIGLTKRIGLRLLKRYRWFEAREDDEIDSDLTLGLGFRF
jgi:opacity protein-like surface antigen